ncbi:hypothetical protein OZ656_05460 [Marinobacter sp. LM1]|jgi:hypothetical protein|uniref:hypothetical protein n=1 Tax=Marinobacter sp. LM1 TaxID=3003349 RepID=UPI0036D3A5E8|tara:strand:- start:445 stop:783 length:339 start_codon:yes stop_codon:yes gene_type:complete
MLVALASELQMDLNEEIDSLNRLFKKYKVEYSVPRVYTSRDAASVREMFRSGMGYGFYDLLISQSNGTAVEVNDELEVNARLHALLDSIRMKIDKYPEYKVYKKPKKKRKKS